MDGGVSVLSLYHSHVESLLSLLTQTVRNIQEIEIIFHGYARLEILLTFIHTLCMEPTSSKLSPLNLGPLGVYLSVDWRGSPVPTSVGS